MWDLRIQGRRTEIVRLIAPRCGLLVSADPTDDVEWTSVAVRGIVTCRELLGALERSPQAPAPSYPKGKPCPEGRACTADQVW